MLLLDGIEQAFLLQTDAILTSALRVLVGEQTADLATATMRCMRSVAVRIAHQKRGGVTRCLPHAIEIR